MDYEDTHRIQIKRGQEVINSTLTQVSSNEALCRICGPCMVLYSNASDIGRIQLILDRFFKTGYLREANNDIERQI